MESPPAAASPANCQKALERAYVLLSYGYLEQALAVCNAAADVAQSHDEEITARSLRGAILSASGRTTQAMRELHRLHRRHRQAILPALYLAEACFLAGRHRRAWKVLDGLDAERLHQSPWAEFAENLRTTWNALADIDDLPEPLTVPIDDAKCPEASQ